MAKRIAIPKYTINGFQVSLTIGTSGVNQAPGFRLMVAVPAEIVSSIAIRQWAYAHMTLH